MMEKIINGVEVVAPEFITEKELAYCAEYAEHHNETHKTKKELPDFANGEEDYLMIGQAESLRQMGIQPPDPNKPIGKYNNAKQTYSKMCREKRKNQLHSSGSPNTEPSSCPFTVVTVTGDMSFITGKV